MLVHTHAHTHTPTLSLTSITHTSNSIGHAHTRTHTHTRYALTHARARAHASHKVHYDGGKFKYFSRSLKPSQDKVTSEIKDWVPKALKADTVNCILDAEVLLVDRSKSG
jgi:hypothetical protein